jgi:hypothetical protein
MRTRATGRAVTQPVAVAGIQRGKGYEYRSTNASEIALHQHCCDIFKATLGVEQAAPAVPAMAKTGVFASTRTHPVR